MSASRWRDERGLTLPIIALMIGTIVIFTSMAVDLGRQRADRRLAQAGADVIALDMMRVVEGRTVDALIADSTNVNIALTDSATRNGFTNEVGMVSTPDPHLPRITALQWGRVPNTGGTFTAISSGAIVPNAVMITAERTTDYLFQPGEGTVTRTAIAALPQPTVNLNVGSVAAGFQPTVPNSATLTLTVQALNARLAAQFGATVPNPGSAGFDLVGYRGLAAADVDIRRIAANAGFASPNELLDSDITVGQFFDATATALDQQAAEGDPNAAAAAAELRRFQTQMGVDSSGTMSLGDMMEFESGGDDAAAEGAVNVLDLLSGGANVVNGDSFVSYNLTPGVPGIAVANVQQYLVKTQSQGFGLGVTDQVENTQARFQIDLQVAPLTGMTAPLHIPLIVEAANATGVVDRLDCADPLAGSEAEIDVTTSGARVRIGTTSDLQANTLVVTPGVLVQGGLGLLNSSVFVALGLSPLQILGLNLSGSLTATGTASVLGGTSTHVFTPFTDTDNNDYQRAPGGVGAANVGTQLSSSLAASLATSALSSAVNNALATQLAYVFNNLQGSILNPIMQQAGVAIAGADVLAWEEKCDGAGLKLVG